MTSLIETILSVVIIVLMLPAIYFLIRAKERQKRGD